MNTLRRYLTRSLLSGAVLLASASLSHAAITVNSVTLGSTQPSVRTTYDVQITPDTDLENGDRIILTFPAQSDLSEANILGVSGTNVSGYNSQNFNNTTKELSFEISANDTQQPMPDAITIQLENVHNPYTAALYDLDVETQDNSNGFATLDTGTGNFTINAALLTVDSIVLDDPTPGADPVTYTVTFTPDTFIEHGYIVEFLFPDGTDLSNVNVALNNDVIGQNPDLTGLSVNNVNGTHLFVQVESNLTSGEDITGTFAFDITDVISSSTGGTYDLPVAIYDVFSAPTEGGVNQFNLQESGIINEASSLSDSSIGATNVTYTLTFDYTASFDADDTIVLTFPDAIDISNVTDGDIALSGGTLTKGVATFSGQEITIPLASGTLTDDTVTITIDGINNPATVSEAGVYYIAIQAFDEGVTFLAQGSFPTSIGSAVQITAVVTEALIMTLSGNTVTLTADPAVNNGVNNSQYTGISVYSNSLGGYIVSARMEDGQGNPTASLTNGNGDEIPTGTGDGTFGYEATNATYDNLRNVDGSQSFSTTSDPLFEENTANSLGHTGVADPVEHTVYYDLDVNFLTPAGVYAGTIYYTVTAAF